MCVGKQTRVSFCVSHQTEEMPPFRYKRHELKFVEQQMLEIVSYYIMQPELLSQSQSHYVCVCFGQQLAPRAKRKNQSPIDPKSTALTTTRLKKSLYR